ncbi:MAG: cation diffusion facilitator family transporter [Chitinivibrionales bacterium]|nr:cation diffusion facilitator family transporter [Chitinivibrionales bacterium]
MSISTPSRPDLDDFKARHRQTQRVVNIGLISNAVLAAAKVIAGIIGNSHALLADGINSVSDVVYFVVVKLFVGFSIKPADREHPYGHYQYESIAALVVGAFVITTGIAIFWDAVNTTYELVSGRVASMRPIAGYSLIVACITIAVKIVLLYHAGNVGRRTGNLAVVALARDHRNDIFASTGAASGILCGMFGVQWADPVAGAVVAILVIKTGFSIVADASSDLMDKIPDKFLAEKIDTVAGSVPGVIKIEEIHAHRFGPYLTANITIGVDGSLTVFEGDRIATRVEKTLTGNVDMLRKVYVHFHPAGNVKK